MNSKFQCERCYNYIEHCWCKTSRLNMVSNGTPPCTTDCICEACIEEALERSLGHLGVEPGESLTAHLDLKCECGAEVVGSGGHSHWCVKYIGD